MLKEPPAPTHDAEEIGKVEAKMPYGGGTEQRPPPPPTPGPSPSPPLSEQQQARCRETEALSLSSHCHESRDLEP